ncbi:red chlorophyll catabolite reductase [Ranunculus cassubicifolius]
MDHKFMEFPYLSPPHRKLMVDLVSTMETRLGSHLLPSSLPQDVKYFENETASSQGTLHIRSGTQDSLVDFVLGSWIHSKLPMGALNITTLTAYLNNTTDAPRFLLEFIQSSPTSLILILDLPHRKDLILYPNYLNTFYTDTQLDQFRQQLHKLPEITPYFSASLYIRCALSPTAVSVVIDCGADGQGRLDEIITDHIGPVAKEMLEIWLDKCACGGRAMVEQERIDLKKRDALVNKKTLDIDLASGLPRLFGPDVASRVIEGIQKYFVS